ncbi:MAG: transcriptional repressor [Bacteroidota bacterium]
MSEEQILKKYSLKNTSLRKQMLAQFLKSNSALSHKDIEDQLLNDFDRVTIYRNLKSFEKKGIIHHVRSDENVSLYALCHEDCSGHNHLDSHVHFKCQSCSKTFCLDEVQIPAIKLPKGYTINELSYLAIGQCNSCA